MPIKKNLHKKHGDEIAENVAAGKLLGHKTSAELATYVNKKSNTYSARAWVLRVRAARHAAPGCLDNRNFS